MAIQNGHSSEALQWPITFKTIARIGSENLIYSLIFQSKMSSGSFHRTIAWIQVSGQETDAFFASYIFSWFKRTYALIYFEIGHIHGKLSTKLIKGPKFFYARVSNLMQAKQVCSFYNRISCLENGK